MGAGEIILRTLVVFLVIFLAGRQLGTKLISRMTFFDFVAGITLGSISAAAIFTTGVKLWVGATALITFALLIFLVDVLNIKFYRVRKYLSGQPCLVIHQGKVQEDKMSQARLTMNDLLVQLRKKGIFYVDEVEEAYLETDGTITILLKPEYHNVTRKDLKIEKPSRGVPHSIIIDGQLIAEKLKPSGKSKAWVDQWLRENDYKMDELALVQVDGKGRIYVDHRNDGENSSITNDQNGRPY